MDEIKKLQRGELALKAYDSLDGVARRLMKTNPAWAPTKRDWLASTGRAKLRRASGRSWATRRTRSPRPALPG